MNLQRFNFFREDLALCRTQLLVTLLVLLLLAEDGHEPAGLLLQTLDLGQDLLKCDINKDLKIFSNGLEALKLLAALAGEELIVHVHIILASLNSKLSDKKFRD